MRTSLFLPPFLVALALSTGIALVFLLLPMFRRDAWRTGGRHRKRSVSRLGGAAMLIAFLATLFLDEHIVLTRELIGLSVGAVFILLFELRDDLKELDWKAQLLFQVALAAIVFIFGMRIDSVTSPFGGAWLLPFGSYVIPAFFVVLAWLLLVINAMNWLDGHDGLCGGVAFITLLTIFLLSLKPEVNQPPIAIVAAIGAGVVAGFLFFNVSPARIQAGSVGSVFLGFLIAVLAIIAGTKIATALLVLSLPIADALWVVGDRLWSGAPVFSPDERHLHHKLRRLGWSENRIAGAFFFLTSLVAFIALNTQALGKFVAILLVLSVIFLLLLLVHSVDRKRLARA